MTVSNFALKRALNLDKVIVFSHESRFSRMRVGSVTRAFLVRIVGSVDRVGSETMVFLVLIAGSVDRVVSVDRVGSVDRVDSVTRIGLGSKLFFFIGD